MKLYVVAAMALALGACCKAAPTSATAEVTPAQLHARGEYIVTKVAGCNDCHTPMGPTGPDMAHTLQGADLTFKPTVDMPWADRAPQIAGLPAGWEEEQFVHFLMTGERPIGVPTLPPMPTYRFNEEDARAVAAYIKSLPKSDE